MSSLGRKEKKVAVLAKLARGRHIGMKYIPVSKALGRIPGHARGDIYDILDEMRREGLLEYHKNGECISINPVRIDAVVKVIRDEVPDYIVERLG